MTDTLQEEKAPEITSFEDLQLDKKIMSALKEMGFEEPYPSGSGRR